MAESGQRSLGQRAAGAMAWNFAGKLYFMLAKYVESIILLRMLGALENGALIGALNIQATLVMFISLGIGNTLLRFLPQIREEGLGERAFLRRLMAFRLAVSLGAGALLVVFARAIAASYLHDESRVGLVYASAVMLVTTSVQNLQTRILVARYRQKQINVIQSAVVTVYLAVAIVGLVAGGGVTLVISANAVATLLGCAWMWWDERKTRPVEQPSAPPTGARTRAFSIRRLVAFSFTFYLYDLLNIVLEKQLDIWMLGFLHPDLRQVTYYALAYNFAFFAYGVFSKVFTEGFTLSLVADVYATGDMAKLRRVFGAIFEYMYLFAIPVAVGGLLLGDDLLRLMYGDEGLGIIGPAMLFLPVMAIGKYSGIAANFLGAMDRERALITSRAIFGAANAAVNVMLIPRYGAWGAAIGTAAATLAGFTYEAVLLHRALRPTYPWKFVAKISLASAVMGLAVAGVCRYVPPADAWRLAVGLPVGVCVFGAMLVVLRPIDPAILEIVGKTRIPGAAFAARWMTPRKSGAPS
ncbi:MAG: polysaccharide biosynthesis protein [Deltaproteobacteria bacterium]|nr:polysaccharide biosynthesis protein [Deltaproteobacteria bacterium]